MSQDDLAERANLSRTSIAHIELGKQECGISTFVRLAFALEMPAEALLSEAMKSATSGVKSRDPLVMAVVSNLRR